MTFFTGNSWKGHGQGKVFIVQCEQGHVQGTYFYSGKGMGKGCTIFFPQLVDDEDYVSMGGGDQLTMTISKTQIYVVASRPVLLNQGLGLLMFSHAGVRRI